LWYFRKVDTSALGQIRISQPATESTGSLITCLIPGYRKRQTAGYLQAISDAISEVQIDEQSVTDSNYRFDLYAEQSFSVGVHSFFQTPIGQAISAAFLIAAIPVVAAVFCEKNRLATIDQVYDLGHI